MATYGFKLFAVGVRKGGNGRKAIELSDVDGKHYGDHLEELLEGLLDRVVLIKPAAKDTGDSRPRGVRIDTVKRNGHRLSGKVSAGRFGDHDLGMHHPDDGGEDADLSELATSRFYRYIFWLPDKGDVGALAVETISRSCPAPQMIKSIRSEALKAAGIEEDASDADEDGDEPGGTWWRIVANVATDDGRIGAMIDNAALETIDLMRHETTSDNKRQQEVMRLSAAVRSEKVKDQVGGILKGWWGDAEHRRRGRATVTSAAGAKQVAAVLGPEVAAIDFDDAAITLVDENGVTKKIKPGSLNEAFIYELGDERPSDAGFLSAVRNTLRSVDWHGQLPSAETIT
ncbi:MAG TPA: hypothetical protein VHE83_09010 [Mycobacteriales bacterium]|nr:hypothetical protein [Mycobacteriales bacterium]